MNVGRFFVLGLVVVGALAACGSSYGDYCSKRTTCIGGNDKDKQACVDEAEAAEKRANDYGCGQQYQDFKTCELAGSSCTMGQWTSGMCDAQNTKVDQCIAGASGIKGGP